MNRAVLWPGPASLLAVIWLLLAPAGTLNLSWVALTWVRAPTSWPLRVTWSSWPVIARKMFGMIRARLVSVTPSTAPAMLKGRTVIAPIAPVAA